MFLKAIPYVLNIVLLNVIQLRNTWNTESNITAFYWSYILRAACCKICIFLRHRTIVHHSSYVIIRSTSMRLPFNGWAEFTFGHIRYLHHSVVTCTQKCAADTLRSSALSTEDKRSVSVFVFSASDNRYMNVTSKYNIV